MEGDLPHDAESFKVSPRSLDGPPSEIALNCAVRRRGDDASTQRLVHAQHRAESVLLQDGDDMLGCETGLLHGSSCRPLRRPNEAHLLSSFWRECRGDPHVLRAEQLTRSLVEFYLVGIL